MKKNIILSIFALSTFLPLPAQAQLFGFLKKKKPKTETQEVKKSNYEKILTDKKCESSHSEFMSLHKTDGKLYVELPLQNLGTEFLVASTLSSVSNPSLGITGFKSTSPYRMRFVQKDSTIFIEYINTSIIHNKADSRLAQTIQTNYRTQSLQSFKINGYNKDSTTVLFDMSPFFLKENKVFPILGTTAGGYLVTSSEKNELAFVNEIKAFPTNVTIKTERTFMVNLGDGRGNNQVENYPTTFQITYTMMRLPEKQMIPRLADTRVGIFQTGRLYMNPENNQVERLAFANRWRVEPADTAAFLAGELSEPLKPIIFYVDSNFPENWKEPIKKGTLRWNAAFEKIGLKNVLQVRDYPADDAQFDPDNLQYSCIRYIPTVEENAMGPSWVDPRTGEIINASVFVYGNITKLIDNWRFVQTAQVDPRVRAKNMPPDVFEESIEYIVAHEVGHTLGFMHNMASSAAYPVDSLRSPSFTAKYGTTASIMDYARYNYVAQPEDKSVSLTPPYLGPFDYLLIEWAYKLFPELNNDFVAESKKLQDLLDSHAGNPFYRHGVQQFAEKRFDPSAIEEDLGDDPVKASNYGLKNLRYILANFNSWITDDEDSKHKTALYNEMAIQAYRYISNVSINVGGIYNTQTSERSGLPRYKVVPKEKQRESVLWLLQQVRDFSSVKSEEFERMQAVPAKPFETIAASLRQMAVANTSRVALGYYLDKNSYSPLEYLEDVYQNVFEKTMSGKENLTEAELLLQKTYIAYLKPFAERAGRTGLSGDLLHIPLELPIPEIDYSIEKSVHFNSTNLGFGNGYGMPVDIWLQSVDESGNYLFHYSEKTLELLKRAAQSTVNSELKLHYAFLLKQLEAARSKK
ncbi:MAG: zinc-dependent metalloprotease [Bacteroidia bacterium]|nr:zinc-dependent metalloprotease [Bacteroidia bacterium]